MVRGEVVQTRAVLTPQPEQVLEAGRREQHRAGPAAFEQRVGRDGRAVQHGGRQDPGRVEGGPVAECRIGRRGGHLRDAQPARGIEGDEIRERPADVDPDPRYVLRHQAYPISSAVPTTESSPTQSPRRV